ncbi:MAG: hypothetical protein JWO54_207 [Candidatus Saccharibacteria bacterium]|nr:hypothetical protein [Candidatus Saccharibacteria bacterium]
MTKIILLRGNAGSGKSTVAREIQNRVIPHPMLIEQDHFRRKIIKEHEGPDIISDKLILETVKFGLSQNLDIIIEGIFPFGRSGDKYKKMFDKIFELHPNENFVYYFDIPFAENVKRHQTRDSAKEFGVEKMKKWFLENDRTNYTNEQIINSSSSLEQTVTRILSETGLL